jgi:DNA-binding CsgD family transcriptional regulator
VVGYNEVDVENDRLLIYDWPDGYLPTDIPTRLPRLAHEHPVLMRNKGGDMAPYAISDFLSRRSFHGLALYQDVYREIGAEDQISFGLPGGLTIGIAMNRSRRGFSARDHAILELVRPHLTQAWRHVQARERKRDLIAALEQGLEETGGAIVMVGRNGRVADASDFARQLLRAYIGGDPARQQLLEDWVAANRGVEPLTIVGSRGSLVIRRLESGSGEGGFALLLTESRNAPPSVVDLLGLGVTRREAEVLRLVATGADNAAIAAQLDIAVATVRKHLERVYAKLGVHSRTEAAATALGVAGA